MTGRRKLLVLAHALLGIVGIAEYRVHVNLLWLPAATTISSILVAQVVLLALWFSWGSTRLIWRAAGLVAGCAYLACWSTLALLWLPEGAEGDENFLGLNYAIALAIYGSLAVIFVPVYLLMRWKFFALTLAPLSPVPASRLRFTILHVLLLTTLICLVLSFSRAALGSDVDTATHTVALYGLVICDLLLAVVAVPWAVLAPGRTWWRLAAVLASAAGMGLSVSFVFYRQAALPHAWQWWWLYFGQAVAIGVVPVVVLILSLAVVRRDGYRLVARTAKPPGDSPFSADDLNLPPATLNSRTTD